MTRRMTFLTFSFLFFIHCPLTDQFYEVRDRNNGYNISRSAARKQVSAMLILKYAQCKSALIGFAIYSDECSSDVQNCSKDLFRSNDSQRMFANKKSYVNAWHS
ncbi:MAG: hypothetical protein K8R21_05670 [Leptospira sp.]|nr:hypothetical protein [Leptospira sp.]